MTSNFLIFNSDSKQFSLVRYTHTFLESESIIGQVSTFGSGWTIGGLTIDGAVANLGKVGFSNLSDELLSKINSAGEEPVQTSWAEKYEEIKTAMRTALHSLCKPIHIIIRTNQLWQGII